MQIIFIEGVSGSGKSSLAQNLRDKLTDIGYSVDCYIEFDFTNPIDFYSTAYFKSNDYENLLAEYPDYSKEIEENTIGVEDIRLIRYYNRETALFDGLLLNVFREREFCYKPTNLVPLSEYSRVYKLIWEHFAQKQSALDYILFDGSLFHHPINDMIRNYNASHDEIAIHVNTLVETVKSLNPYIVYLSADNITKRLQKARVSRSQTPPSDTQIQFWKARKQADLSVLSRLNVPHKIYDISQENWIYVQNQVLNDIL